MHAKERQRQIKNTILEQKSVSVADLTNRFGVTFETIRRDLKLLEDEGLIEKSYGGAALKQRVNTSVDYDTLSKVMVDSKKKMADLAVKFISQGDCIYIDFSSTCTQIAYSLSGDTLMTVLTSSLPALNELAKKAGINLYSTGGNWDSRNRAFVGRTAVETISQYHLDKAFISCRGINMENGLSDRTETESDIRRKIIDAANEVYLLADYSKFDKFAFVKTSGFGHIKAIITDRTLPDDWRNFLDDRHIACYDCEHTYTFE